MIFFISKTPPKGNGKTKSCSLWKMKFRRKWLYTRSTHFDQLWPSYPPPPILSKYCITQTIEFVANGIACSLSCNFLSRITSYNIYMHNVLCDIVNFNMCKKTDSCIWILCVLQIQFKLCGHIIYKSVRLYHFTTYTDFECCNIVLKYNISAVIASFYLQKKTEQKSNYWDSVQKSKIVFNTKRAKCLKVQDLVGKKLFKVI